MNPGQGNNNRPGPWLRAGSLAITLLVMPAEAQESKRGWNLAATYTADLWHNARGGLHRGNAYLDNLDLTAELDAESLWGWDDTRIFIYGLYNNGRTLSSDHSGDLQVVSNIETGVEALRLYEAWIETPLAASTSLRFGLYDLNSEFDVLDSAEVFLHSAHGIGTDMGQTGRNGPSIFPVTSLAARMEWRGDGPWAVRAAVLDGVPGDPDHPGDTAVELGSDDGALLISELEWRSQSSKVLVGTWGYTARFDEWSAAAEGLHRSRGNAGFYLRGETTLDNSGVTVFGRYGRASGEHNVFSDFLGAGLTVAAPLRGNRRATAGFAIAWAESAAAYRAGRAGVNRREVALEATYRIPLGESWTIQPDVQYVINPGLDGDLDDAAAIGLRVEFSP